MEIINTPTKPAPSKLLRWLVLGCVSMIMFGIYYIYDAVSPLADLLKSQLHLTDSNIGLLNGIYSVPNIFMVLIGGMIIDRIGPRKASFIFTVLCAIGAAITPLKGDLWLMATGRFIYGLGAESLIVAVTTVIARWFRGKELSFAFGLNLTLARIGSFAALNSPSWLGSMYQTWQKPLFFSAVMGLVSVLAAIIYYIMESQAERKYELGQSAPSDKIAWSAILNMGAPFWYISILCVTFYSGIFPFQTFAVKFFMEHHGLSREMAGFTSSFITSAAMIGTPVFGLLVDRMGRRASMMTLGSILLLPVYLMLIYLPIHPLIPMVMMGLAFSLIPAAMWPSVALIVEENKLGTAYGLMTMIQNIGLAGFNFLIGWANDASGGYTAGMWIFSILGFTGILFAQLLKRADRRCIAGRLENTKMQRS